MNWGVLPPPQDTVLMVKPPLGEGGTGQGDTGFGMGAGWGEWLQALEALDRRQTSLSVLPPSVLVCHLCTQ